jgi:hypothetical protein
MIRAFVAFGVFDDFVAGRGGGANKRKQQTEEEYGEDVFFHSAWFPFKQRKPILSEMQ